MNRISQPSSGQAEAVTTQAPEATVMILDQTLYNELPTKLAELMVQLNIAKLTSEAISNLIKVFAKNNNASLDTATGELFYQGYSLKLALFVDEPYGYLNLPKQVNPNPLSFPKAIAYYIFTDADKKILLSKYAGIETNEKPRAVNDLETNSINDKTIEKLYADLSTLANHQLSHPIFTERVQDYLLYGNARFFVTNPESIISVKQKPELISLDDFKKLLRGE